MAESTSSSQGPRVGGVLVLLALALFIGAGLFLAYREVPAPLQGQIDARTINVAPKITARITEHHVREGDAVTPGMVLVTLDSPEVRAKVLQAEAARTAADAQRDLVREGAREEEIRAAKAQWDKARTGAELAERTFRRIDALYQEGLLPLQRKDEAEANFRSAQDSAAAARAQYDTALAGARAQEKAAAAARVEQAAGSVAEINALAADQVLEAPLAAEVDKVVLHPGELAPAGFPILTLVDLNDIWAVFNVREDQFEGIAIGAELTGTVPALGGRTVRFKVFYISPKGDYATWRATRQSSGYDIRTFEVRARPAEAVEGLRPGMSVLVER